MRHAVRTIFVVVFLAALAVKLAPASETDIAAAIAQAKRLIDAKDYAPAVILLEDLLPETDAENKPAVLELLRKSYEVMAREAKAAGRDREAAHLLENLSIITAVPRSAPLVKPPEPKPRQPAAPQAPAPVPSTPRAPIGSPSRNISLMGAAQDLSSTTPPEPMPPVEPARMPALQPLELSPKELSSPDPSKAGLSDTPIATIPSPKSRESAPAAPVRKAPSDLAIAAARGQALSGTPDGMAQPGEPKSTAAAGPLEEADRLFSARKYLDAGERYATLARQNELPPQRKQHWAYCRMVEVARRINLRPRSKRDWDQIEAEIVDIQRLSPNIWYGEYLRNKVSEVRRLGRRAPTKSDNLVVRGTAPDENESQPERPQRRLPRIFGNSRTDADTQKASADTAISLSPATEIPLNLPGEKSSTSPVTVGSGASDRPTGSSPAAVSEPAQNHGSDPTDDGTVGAGWQIYETANFRIYHRDARLAETAGRAAESVRIAQAKRWGTIATQKPWSPACEIYLYPSGKAFARDTKQPEESPGFSTMECNGSRVVARRVNLRADHPQVVAAVLPHEVTHVVLADLFTSQQIPRWADEGLAVLAEPNGEQQTRAAELQEPLEGGRVFDLSKLMAMDYPDAKDWSLYYAQSVSLTRFLVEKGRPEQFIQFVKRSQREGIESALRGSYQIADLAELQSSWAEYARHQSGPVRSASRTGNVQPAGTEVK
jgi:hypothetical protein